MVTDGNEVAFGTAFSSLVAWTWLEDSWSSMLATESMQACMFLFISLFTLDLESPSYEKMTNLAPLKFFK